MKALRFLFENAYRSEVKRGASVDDSLNLGYWQHHEMVSSEFPWNVQLTANAGEHLRVAIAWNSHTDTAHPPSTDVLNADFDLYLKNPSGSTVDSSTSWDNNWELIDFQTTVTGTYTVTVSRVRFDAPSEVWALAWSRTAP